MSIIMSQQAHKQLIKHGNNIWQMKIQTIHTYERSY